MEDIHDRFVSSAQSLDSRYRIFDVISEWIQHLKEIQANELNYKDETLPRELLDEAKFFLNCEVETWDLLLMLYYFRLNEKQDMTDHTSYEFDVDNEAVAVDTIIERNPTLNEIRKILDWLEANFAKKQEPDWLEKFINWENTLDALNRGKKLGGNIANSMVSQIDPDVCYREKKGIHVFDTEEETRVQKGLYYYVRSGQTERAVEFLQESGNLARAAMFSGFCCSEKIPVKLESSVMESIGRSRESPDETMHSINFETPQNFAFVGNTERDLWKSIAFEICQTNDLAQYERAALGAFCGHKKAMLDASLTWQDKLWASLKTVLDIRIENDLRRSKDLVPMPKEYWEQDSEFSDCLKQIHLNEDDLTKKLENVFQLVQLHVIKDDMEGLIQKLKQLLAEVTSRSKNEYDAITGHLLRFVTHLLLILGILDLGYDEDLMNLCIESYVKFLAQEEKLISIPYYIEKLTADKQCKVLVEQIRTDGGIYPEMIQYFMQAAHVNNLDVLNIANEIVNKLRNAQKEFRVENLFWIKTCHELVQDPREVMASLLKHVVLIIRKYLVLKNLKICNQAARQISEACVNDVTSLAEEYEGTLVREFVSYKIYLDAEDALQVWQRSLRLRPTSYTENETDQELQLSLADKEVLEKKRLAMKSSDEKYNRATSHHLKNSIDRFMNVLTFPSGWLSDCVSPLDEQEFNTVKSIRRFVLSKVVFILIQLIKEQKSMQSMRNFIYVFCEDDRGIVNEFTTAELTSIFKAAEEFMRVSSLTLREV